MQTGNRVDQDLLERQCGRKWQMKTIFKLLYDTEMKKVGEGKRQRENSIIQWRRESVF